MARGYMGKVLNVDLSSGKMEDEPLDDDLCHNFIGGYGLGARLLYDRIPVGADPLGPENIVGFLTGPLTGTPCIEGNRFVVVCKSPLTGTWGDANCGGNFGPYLKFAGYDGLLFSGIAERPVYLYVEDGKPELRDASHLWGKDTNETEDILKKELGDAKNLQVASIGQAGEKLALIACVINDKGRAAGRSGVGAAMGAKRLKAVVVKGSMSVPLADEEKAEELRRIYMEKHNGIYDTFRTYGTIGITGESSWSGDSPIKNWGGVGIVDFPTGGSRFADDVVIAYETRKYGCWRCTIACGGHMEVKDPGPYQGASHHKVEYETAAAFGGMPLNDNFPSLIKINELCNRYGLDTISAGCTVSFAIECYENGLLAKADTGGLELTWGNDKAIVALVELMGKREGIGNLLADGAKRAAEQMGEEAMTYAIHIQGQEVPMHDPKFEPGLATTYQMDATPARHTQGGAYWFPPGYRRPKGFNKYQYSGKGEVHKQMANLMHVVNAAGVCMFGYMSYDYNMVPDFLTAITGWDFSLDRCYLTGERIANMRHAFNLREGLNPLQYEVPRRTLGDPPQSVGNVHDVTVDLATQVREFCEAMDWDPVTTRPSKKKLKELGLEHLIKDLY
ncbi:MAG: aldehyde ferredoxin oxidoreductase family protein [Anaerolineae bacterium]